MTVVFATPPLPPWVNSIAIEVSLEVLWCVVDTLLRRPRAEDRVLFWLVDWHYRYLLVFGFLFVLFLLSDVRVGAKRGVLC
jgi:hypothetical protein